MSFGDEQPESIDGAPEDREAPSSQLNQDFMDDSSAAMGIGHHATRVDGFEWNERQNRKEKARLEREGIAYGPASLEKGISNRGAYADDARCIADVRAEYPDMSLVDATKIGRERAEAARLSGVVVKSAKDRDREYLGDTIENLAKYEGEISHSGGRHKKPKPPANADTVAARRERNYEGMIADESGPLSEKQRAERAIAQNAARLEGACGSGRPLKGSEPRMRTQARLEPHVVYELNDMTGKNTGELLEEMHALLSMAKSGVERMAIAKKLEELIIANVEAA